MKTRAIVDKGSKNEEPFYAAVIVRENGTGEGFGWWADYVSPDPTERQAVFAKAVFGDLRGYLEWSTYQKSNIDFYEDPTLEELQQIRNYKYVI